MKLFKQHDPAIVFSVAQGNRDEDADNYRIAALWLDANDVPFKPVSGRYNGWFERGFVINASELGAVKELLLKYNQHSYLLIDEVRKAYDVPVSGDEAEFLGQWQTVGKVNADEDYTYDPVTRVHYVCR